MIVYIALGIVTAVILYFAFRPRPEPEPEPEPPIPEPEPEPEPPSPKEEGKYTLAAFYACVEDETVYANWQERVRKAVEYEAKLWVDYIKGQGYVAELDLIAVEKVVLESGRMSYYEITQQLEAEHPNYNKADLRIVVGSWNSGTAAICSGDTVFMYLATLQNEIECMEGNPEPRFNDMCYSEFAHEFGHTFYLDHCKNRPCPMAQQTMTYSEWCAGGKTLQWCNEHRAKLLKNWKTRNYVGG